MINIMLPMAGTNPFFPEDEFHFPKALVEFNGKTMIEHVIQCFDSIPERQFLFVLSSEDCNKYHLDNVLELVTNHECRIIRLDHDTMGAACSSMMAVSHIDNDTPLIIANSDQVFDIDLSDALDYFTAESADAGVITFESIHPRWSYVRLDEQDRVIETAEKHPISKTAIAGFYYYRKGSDFMRAAEQMVKKDANVNGSYYIAPTLNEMVLARGKILHYAIDNGRYHTFYTPQKIKEYERRFQSAGKDNP